MSFVCVFSLRVYLLLLVLLSKFQSYFDDNNHDAVPRANAPQAWQATKATALFG
jgi:hypothetical protein